MHTVFLSSDEDSSVPGSEVIGLQYGTVTACAGLIIDRLRSATAVIYPSVAWLLRPTRKAGHVQESWNFRAGNYWGAVTSATDARIHMAVNSLFKFSIPTPKQVF